MKRILIVDDEQPVIDHIVRIVERDLAAGFCVVGTASSGRETLEKVPSAQPDIVVLDVRMPGLSGLDTVRELRRRGAHPAFILCTAYERFDIAREALELGITGYLLKPVAKEALAQALNAAAEQVDRRTGGPNELAQEQDFQVKGFATDAFLSGLMLGRDGGQLLRSVLGLSKPWGLIAAAAFSDRSQESRDALESVLQYKTLALCGPLVYDRCLIFVPLALRSEAALAERALVETVNGRFRDELGSGRLRLAFADARPLDNLARSWPEALGRLSRGGTGSRTSEFLSGQSFEEEEEFHAALFQGDAVHVKTAFETLLAPFEDAASVSIQDRYRVIVLLGSALGRLVALRNLEESVAHQGMDFDDLRHASDGREFCLLARSRLPAITGALSRARRWSAEVSAAVEYIRGRYGQQVTLDLVAEHVGVSPKRLSRLFIEDLQQGFSEYVIDFRIEQAKILLSLPGATIKQVSKECGYPDPNYFARLFKKVTGTTPSEFSALL